MIERENINDVKLKDVSCNVRAICAGWELMHDLNKLDADMISIVRKLAKDICDELDGFLSKKITFELIQLQLFRIGELQSLTKLCLDYVFDSTINVDLHHQLNFLSRNVSEAANILERKILQYSVS
jgi:hypothetical protein